MCIAILTTSHPDYPFILINNRDEYVARPTHPADFWPPPNSDVLGGWDLERSAHGTWLGVTRGGRIACLTNYHEIEGGAPPVAAKSRGLIVNGWLKGGAEGSGKRETPEEFAARLVREDDFQGVGGFILTFGDLRDVRAARAGKCTEGGGGQNGHTGEKEPKGLPVLSNRTEPGSALPYVARGPGHTSAVSNAPFGDRSWRKIAAGESLLDAAVRESVAAAETREQLITRLLGVLEADAVPEWDGVQEWRAYCRRMEDSVFVRALRLHAPPAPPGGGGGGADGSNDGSSRYDVQSGSKLNGSAGGLYGTQKQTVLLVDHEGVCTYFERTLFGQDEAPIEKGAGDRQFEFRIENW